MVARVLPSVAYASFTPTLYVTLDGQPASPCDLNSGRDFFVLYQNGSVVLLNESTKGTFTRANAIDGSWEIWWGLGGGHWYFFDKTSVSDSNPTLTVNCFTATYNLGTNGVGSVQTDIAANGANFTFRGATYTRTDYVQTGLATSDGGAKVYDLGGVKNNILDTDPYPVWTLAS